MRTCSLCGRQISAKEYATYMSACRNCYGDQADQHRNAERNRAERGRPGRRPPPGRS